MRLGLIKMALLQNNFLHNQSPIRWRQGNFAGMARHEHGRTSRLNQSQQYGALASVPAAATPPTCWILPRKAGAMASRGMLVGSSAITPFALVQGRNLGAPLTGSGGITGTARLIISMVAALSGSGQITSATAQGYLQLAANLAGGGNLSGAIKALAHAAAALEGEGTAAATIRATGTLAAALKVTGDLLDSSNVGNAVWSAVAARNNEPGSMGEKINDAGSASNPWTEVIESGFTAAEILRLIASVLAGKSSGGGSSPITFRDLADSKDRITATVDESGNRTEVVKDVA
jgi:hypothetical protein